MAVIGKALDRLSEWTWLDSAAGVARDTVKRILPSPVRDVLHGTSWLGHPLHPALVQVPVGCWTAAGILDLLTPRVNLLRRSGMGAASTTLMVTGVAGALPAAVAGWTDFADLHEDQQRAGLVHAVANLTATGCYAAAAVQRLRGRRGPGSALSAAGLLTATAGGIIGGHLSYRWAAGANHAEQVPHATPGGWHDIGRLDDFPDGAPAHARIGDTPVVVVRRGGHCDVLADTCTHLAGPLHEGKLDTVGGRECIVCPWHGSAFALRDGAVTRGPATADQPRFSVDLRGERVFAAVVELPGVPAS